MRTKKRKNSCFSNIRRKISCFSNIGHLLMGKNFHMIMKNDIHVSILLPVFLRLTIEACMRKLFKKNDFVWNVYQVLFLNYFLKWVHGFFFFWRLSTFFFFICTRDYNETQILPSSSRKYFFFVSLVKIILISWNQFSFGPKSLFTFGIGR